MILTVALGAVIASVYIDFGTPSWFWFQRSGSVLVICGAVLGFRSIVRLGVKGVGGANTNAFIGRVESSDDTQPIRTLRISLDDETKRYLVQAAMDKLAGYIGAFLIVCGTLIAGYGDLIGRMLS